MRSGLRVRCGCEGGRRRRRRRGKCPGHALGVRWHGTAGSGWRLTVSKVTAVCPEIDTDTAGRECARTRSWLSFLAQALAVVLATNKQSREAADRLLISGSAPAFSKSAWNMSVSRASSQDFCSVWAKSSGKQTYRGVVGGGGWNNPPQNAGPLPPGQFWISEAV